MNAIVSALAMQEYVSVPATNISSLKELLRSPQHYRHRLAHPKKTAPMTLGTAAHCAVLEPERFATEYVAWTRTTESGRAAPRNGKAWDAYCAEHAERTILTADEYADALAIRDAVRGDVTAMKYIGAGDAEVSMRWEMHGRQCKGRVDWITHVDGQPVIVGLKTARNASHFPFASAAEKLGYHLQWAWYFDGYGHVTGKVPRVVEIVVESDAPHAVVVYDIPPDVIDQGRDEYMELLRLLAECEKRDEWPGYALGEQTLSLPSWVYGADDDINDIDLEVTS